MAISPTGKERTLWRLSRARKLPEGWYLVFINNRMITRRKTLVGYYAVVVVVKGSHPIPRYTKSTVRRTTLARKNHGWLRLLRRSASKICSNLFHLEGKQQLGHKGNQGKVGSRHLRPEKINSQSLEDAQASQVSFGSKSLGPINQPK